MWGWVGEECMDMCIIVCIYMYMYIHTIIPRSSALCLFCIAGNFQGGGGKVLVGLTLFSWLLLALQVKAVKVASFVKYLCSMQCSTTNILPPGNSTSYTVLLFVVKLTALNFVHCIVTY